MKELLVEFSGNLLKIFLEDLRTKIQENLLEEFRTDSYKKIQGELQNKFRKKKTPGRISEEIPGKFYVLLKELIHVGMHEKIT